MPAIPPEVLKCTFYLYHSVEDAKRGAKFGGTGFFFGVPLGWGMYSIYAVTNWHVALDQGASVIRVNKHGGSHDIFDLDPAEWFFKPKSYDLAVAQIRLDEKVHDFTFLGAQMALTKEGVNGLRIGPGDDVLMSGRFVDHDGGDTNVPAMRSGIISVMPGIPIKHPNGAEVPSYILDVHSRTGYSGSPVFVYRTVGSDFAHGKPLQLGPDKMFLRFLGIHWGQFPEAWEIKRARRSKRVKSHAATLTAYVDYVEGMSGMTLVDPAWALLELLDMPQLKEKRDRWIGERERAVANHRVAAAAQDAGGDLGSD